MKYLLYLAFAGAMLHGQVTIVDTIKTPMGGNWSGTVQVTLNNPATAQPLYAGSETLSGWSQTVTVTNGAFSITLYANDTITPTGTSYTARYTPTSGSAWSETWVVPTGATTIRELRSTTVPTPRTMFTPSQITQAGAALNNVLRWNGSNWAPFASILTDPMTTTGDMIFRTGGVPSRLGIGTTGQVLTVTGGAPVWATGISGNAATATALQTALGAGRLLFGNGTGTPTTDAGAMWDATNRLLSARGAVGGSAISATLSRFYSGGLTGKRVVYFGNSTAWNAAGYYTRIYREMIPGGVLEGLSVRSDVSNLSSTAGSAVTVTLSSAVGSDAVVGEWISLTTLTGTGANGCQGSGIVTAVSGNDVTFSLANGSCASVGSTAATGFISKSFLNFGNNGASLTFMLGNTTSTSTGIGGVCAVAPDLLIVRGGLINDVRLGATNLSQATARLRELIDAVRACSPNTDIILKSENSLLTTDVGGAGFVSPNESAQAYSTILRQAVLAQAGTYPNVFVHDLQALLYGVTSPATSVYMVDQLHPSATGYAAEADLDVNVLEQLRPAVFATKGSVSPASIINTPFSPYLAQLARAQNYAVPWTFYPHACADPEYYELIATGKHTNATTSAGATFFDITWPGGAAAMISNYDVVQQESAGCWLLGKNTGATAIAANSRINLRQSGGSDSTPYAMQIGERISIWRPKYPSSAAEPLLRNPHTNQYSRRVRILSAGAGYIDISFLGADRWRTAGASAISTADTLYLAANGTQALSGCTFQNSGYLRCLIAGTYTALDSDWGFVIGTHPAEGEVNTAGLLALSLGASIASAATIAPTAAVTPISGTTTIDTITLPYTGFRGCLKLVPTDAWATSTAGNIQIATTATVSRVLEMCWTGSKWFPSY